MSAKSLKVDVLKLQRESLIKKADELEALTPIAVTTSAWCADLTEDLSGEVGTIEIPGESVHLQIQPGYEDNAEYDEDRDGILNPTITQSPAQAYYNLAMLPGWQKWMPTYRHGTLSNLSGDLCTVTLDQALSSQQDLDVNQSTVLNSVPIDYMECNGAAFSNGDKVLVEFEGQEFTSPKVIGFKDNPQPCGTRILKLTARKLYAPNYLKKYSFYWDVQKDSLATWTKNDGSTGTAVVLDDDVSNWLDTFDEVSETLYSAKETVRVSKYEGFDNDWCGVPYDLSKCDGDTVDESTDQSNTEPVSIPTMGISFNATSTLTGDCQSEYYKDPNYPGDETCDLHLIKNWEYGVYQTFSALHSFAFKDFSGNYYGGSFVYEAQNNTDYVAMFDLSGTRVLDADQAADNYEPATTTMYRYSSSGSEVYTLSFYNPFGVPATGTITLDRDIAFDCDVDDMSTCSSTTGAVVGTVEELNYPGFSELNYLDGVYDPKGFFVSVTQVKLNIGVKSQDYRVSSDMFSCGTVYLCLEPTGTATTWVESLAEHGIYTYKGSASSVSTTNPFTASEKHDELTLRAGILLSQMGSANIWEDLDIEILE